LSDVSLQDGLTTDQLVLILAHQRDEEHHPSPAPGPLLPEQPTKTPSPHPVFRKTDLEGPTHVHRPSATVLLVDDEAPVRQIVADELRKAGYEVRTAQGPAEALAVSLELLRPDGKDLIVVADLGMPTTSQTSYLGGLELVRNLVERGVDAPVLLTAENLSESSRDEAKRLGVRKVVFKPSLSKLDSGQYKTDLRSLAALLIELLKETEIPAGEARERAAAEPEASAPLARHFLSSMGEQLTDPERSLRISNHVLPVVACLASPGRTQDTLFEEGAPSEVAAYSNVRKYERVLSRIEATFSCKKEVGNGYLSDLSEEGAFLNTNKLFPVGEIVRLRISLPYRLGEVTAEARIVWLNYKAHDLDTAPHGMGLKFIEPFS
jgi:CheY-like chemotaxis protein